MPAFSIAIVLVLLGTGLALNLAVLVYVGVRCLRVLLAGRTLRWAAHTRLLWAHK